MGLFKKSYVDRIKDISERLHEVSLSEDDLILNFNDDVREVKHEDTECIELLQNLAMAGHISERLKRELLNHLAIILDRLKKLRFEGHSRLGEIIAEIETVLRLELTIERIGIEFSGFLYHGTPDANIQEFDKNRQDPMLVRTLGNGIYLTNSKQMSINYGFYRAGGQNTSFSVYTLRLKDGRNFLADLNHPLKVRSIYGDLVRYFQEIPQTDLHDRVREVINDFLKYLEFVIDKDIIFANISHLVVPKYYPEASTKLKSLHINLEYIMRQITNFLKSVGFHGLRCEEGGEVGFSLYPWSNLTSYVIFDEGSIEIVSEERFMVKDGKLLKIE